MLKWSIVSLAIKWARLEMPEALSLQYCSLSNENDLKAAILHKRAEIRWKEEYLIKKLKNLCNICHFICMKDITGDAIYKSMSGGEGKLHNSWNL